MESHGLAGDQYAGRAKAGGPCSSADRPQVLRIGAKVVLEARSVQDRWYFSRLI